jgi:C-type mannose receptor
MRTGIAGGLWDVLKCDEKAKFVCKHWAEGVTRPPEPPTTPEPKCPEDWGTTSKTSLCFKASIKSITMLIKNLTHPLASRII